MHFHYLHCSDSACQLHGELLFIYSRNFWQLLSFFTFLFSISNNNFLFLLPEIGLFQKKTKHWGRHNFLKPLPWNFYVSYFTLKTSRQYKAIPLEIQQNCVASLGNSKFKNLDPWNLNMNFFLIKIAFRF